MAKNKNPKKGKEFDEKIWKFAEKELEIMLDEWISQKFQEQTAEKNEEEQEKETDSVSESESEKKLKIGETWKNDKLSKWDWKKKEQDRKYTKDLSTLTEIKISPSSKPQIIRFIVKHDGSQLKVPEVKDFSTQVHPNDFNDLPLSEQIHSMCHEAFNASLVETNNKRKLEQLQMSSQVKDFSTQVHPNDFNDLPLSEQRHSMCDEASSASLMKANDKRMLERLQMSPHTMRTLEWVESTPLNSDFDQPQHSNWVLMLKDEEYAIKSSLSKHRQSSHHKPSNSRLRKTKTSSPIKTSWPRSLPPDFNTGDWSSRNQRKCWNCGSPFHDYTNCDVPSVRVFCYTCGEPGVTRNRCHNCSRTSSEREIAMLYKWCTRCGNQGVDISTCPKCNKPAEFNKTL